MIIAKIRQTVKEVNIILQKLSPVELEMRGGNWAQAVGGGTLGAFAGGGGTAAIVGSDAMAGVELGALGGPWGVAAGAAVGATAGVIMGLWG